MYGAGNPQMAALGALGALGGTLRELAMSPVRRWGQASIMHKVIAAGAGAGLAYYLHKRGMHDVAVAVIGLGGAYAASAVMHYPEVARSTANGALPATQPVSGALPPAQVQSMAAQAQNVMNNAGALAPAAPGGAQPQEQQPTVIGATPPQPQAQAAAPMGSSKWALLG
jgi:hypothetical protein